MNMKKTLAGLMAGVVAISAMATVAVSAKAQEAKTKTWTTSWTEKEKTSDKTAEVMFKLVAVEEGDVIGKTYTANADITAADTTTTEDDEEQDPIFEDGDTLEKEDYDGLTADGKAKVTVEDVLATDEDATPAWEEGSKLKVIGYGTGAVEIKKLIKIVNRGNVQAGSAEIIDRPEMYMEINSTNKDEIDFITDVPTNLEGADLEVWVEVETKNTIKSAAFKNSTIDGNKVAASSNAAPKSEDKIIDKGIIINKNTDRSNVEVVGDIAYVEDLDREIRYQAMLAVPDKDSAKSKNIVNNLKVSEATEEMMDYMLDAKGAEITFTFLKKDYKVDEDYTTFDQWYSRYDWNSDSVKSAISLRVNDSNVLSVSMKDFDKENFAATFSWDEVMSKFQGGSYTGLVRDLGFKVDNSKLPTDKDGKTIDLEIASITVKVPEMKETEDDTMVEDIVKDFAAGESATVVEDTLPAASDAPAATDAPATTDAANNPETGNSAAALLAIPAALAAAAIVAKKRG
ncbi:MAG: hypothetical protein J5992_00375 [Oscillospiraceae bacterium]|nr:hypothetical protein [Oscillospiraceae bacterium]